MWGQQHKWRQPSTMFRAANKTNLGFIYQTVILSPKSAHLLTSPALTDDFLLVSVKENSQSQKEARRKSRAGEVLTDEESHYLVRYSHPTPCYSLARPPKYAHLLTPPALTHDCHCVYISYRAGLSLKKDARLAMDAQYILDNPNIKLAALRTPGTTKSFSHPTFHNPAMIMK